MDEMDLNVVEKQKLESIVCPLCGVDETRRFLKRGPERIVRCRHCGLVYVNPRPVNTAVGDFFENKYIPDDEKLEVYFTVYRAPALRLEAKIIKKYKAQGRILDIGCAGGEFLSHFLDDDWICEGIEPSQLAASKARSLGIKTVTGMLEEVSLEKQHYDVISVIDTLFFMAWPLQNLKKLHKALKDDGIIAVEIPGFAFRMARNIGPLSLIVNRRWIYIDQDSPHLFYLTRRALRHMLEAAGFEVISEYPIPSPAHGSWFYRLMMKIYFVFSVMFFYLTFKQINLAAKTLFISRKRVNREP